MAVWGWLYNQKVGCWRLGFQRVRFGGEKVMGRE